MDDLAGLDWKYTTSTSKPNAGQRNAFQQADTSSSRPSIPPFTSQNRGSTSMPITTARSGGTATDSFSNLLAPKSSKSNGLSLQDRQRQLEEDKRKQLEAQSKQYQSDAQYWEGLGSGRGTPAPAVTPSSQYNSPIPDQTNDDLLAAFGSAAPVDTSSHFPPPRSTSNTRLDQSSAPAPSTISGFQDDDDPFGLNEFQSAQKSRTPASATQPVPSTDADDILGALGRPVTEQPRRPSPQPVINEPNDEDEGTTTNGDHPASKAVAELVDMGFPAERAREALESTESGTDVQAAVGWLLTRAHEESRSRSRPKLDQDRPDSQTSNRGAGPERASRDAVPAWARHEAADSQEQSRSSSAGEKDVRQYAAGLANNFFKTTNSLWKTGQKRVQRAVADFQQSDSDSSQPRWMREVQASSDASSDVGRSESTEGRYQAEVTNEAMMLETQRATPPPRQSQPHPSRQRIIEDGEMPVRQRSPFAEPSVPDRRPSPSFPSQSLTSRRAAERLTRQALEEENAQTYISPARRRKPAPKVDYNEPSLDIFNAAPSVPASKAPATRSAPPSKPSAPIQVRPKATTRNFTQVSASILAASASDRQKGTDAFKRGDYTDAHTHYTNALTPLPGDHPIAIIVRCNRALTNTKVGDPKAAVVDADAAIAIIGPSQGEGESIALGGGEADKDMKEFFGKAIMRKAEALEHMEKWAEAAKIWRDAVQAGVGGSVSIQGRNRCEKASGNSSSQPAAAPKNPPKPPKPAKKVPSAYDQLNGTAASSAAEGEAVKKLRAANAAAAAASDEAFALTDAVDAKLVAWKAGKADNLRALLASLDTVLWADAGWKKIGMGDLVMPPKVKINYMKAIAKVHPDKLPQTATTEQKMISASVFATLNEAWDSFKKANGL